MTPKYFDHKSGTVHDKANGDYWCLVDGTPATCVQLGLFHHDALFPTHEPLASRPIDLVISGPNYGRNTTAAFALSSGTLGGALEAAVCGVRAIAISFAFFTRQESPQLIQEACVLGAKVVNRLHKNWPHPKQQGEGSDSPACAPDLYSINIPLKAGVGDRPIQWTWMLDNKWRNGSLYKSVDGTDEEFSSDSKNNTKQKSFRWSPSFADVWKTVENSPAGNDGLAIREGFTSVTPLHANIESAWGKGEFVGELKL